MEKGIYLPLMWPLQCALSPSWLLFKETKFCYLCDFFSILQMSKQVVGKIRQVMMMMANV